MYISLHHICILIKWFVQSYLHPPASKLIGFKKDTLSYAHIFQYIQQYIYIYIQQYIYIYIQHIYIYIYTSPIHIYIIIYTHTILSQHRPSAGPRFSRTALSSGERRPAAAALALGQRGKTEGETGTGCGAGAC